MKTFASLVGTNTNSTVHQSIFDSLLHVAVQRGFSPPAMPLRIREYQVSPANWSLELHGPTDERAAFFLAVTAPRVPSIAPIPITQTVDGPLFSVVVMDTFCGVWCDGDYSDSYHPDDSVRICERFGTFLDSLSEPTPKAKQ